MSIEGLTLEITKKNQSINQFLRIGLYVNWRIDFRNYKKNQSINQFLRIGLYDFRNYKKSINQS